MDWLRSNKLSLNESKTELIIFHPVRKELPRSPNIKLNKYHLKLQPYVKYLGVYIDEILSWNKQIDIISQKLARSNGLLSKLRHFVPLDVSLSVYYSIFYSYLLYGCLTWSYTSQGNITRLTKLQKSCVRILTFSKFDAHTNPIFSQLNLIKLADIFTIQKLLFMFESFHGLIPEELKRLFIFNKSVYPYETRSQNLFHLSKAITTRFGINTLRFDGPNLWNHFYKDYFQDKNLSTKISLKNF